MVAVSPGSRYLSLLNGQVVSVGPGPALAAYPARVPLSSETTIAWPDPFADQGRALVMLRDYGTVTGSSPVSVVSLATGRQVTVGAGEHVAGDPGAAGAFVSVAAPARASAASAQASPDSRVELRDAARHPVLLATAGALNRDLGVSASTPVALAAYPSPSGAEVAVTVQPVAGGTAAGVVIMSRGGRVLGTARASLEGQSVPVWSASGGSLAYLSTGSGQGPELSVWVPGGRPVSRNLPPAAGAYSTCVWSPDGKTVLCSASSGARWAIAPAGGGQAVAVRGAGYPVTWLPGIRRTGR